MPKPKLSVAIITKNEEDRLPKTLEAIKDLADEIVVVDSGSTDRTVEIAKAYGAKVFVEDWKGFGPQKQSAFEKTTGQWVLFLDADEVPTRELKEEIKRVLENPKAEGYFIKRRAVYLGKKLRFVWANEWLLRLVKRSAAPRWVGKIHERLLLDGKTEKIKRGELLHYTYRNLSEHLEKVFKYAKIGALEGFERGKKSSTLKVLTAPVYTFLKYYFLKLALLEGYRGFLIAAIAGIHSFVKYSLLKELWERPKSSAE